MSLIIFDDLGFKLVFNWFCRNLFSGEDIEYYIEIIVLFDLFKDISILLFRIV